MPILSIAAPVFLERGLATMPDHEAGGGRDCCRDRDAQHQDTTAGPEKRPAHSSRRTITLPSDTFSVGD